MMRIALSLLVGCFSFHLVAATLGEAESLFPRYHNVSAGVYEAAGISMVVVEIVSQGDADADECSAMLHAKDMLKGSAMGAEGAPPVADEVLGKGLATLASAAIPFEFRGESRVLQNGPVGKSYRYVMVVMTSDMMAARPGKALAVGVSPWIVAFRHFLSEYRMRGDSASLVIINSRVGAVEDCLAESMARIGDDFNLETVVQLPGMDNLVGRARLLRAEKMARLDPKAALDLWPGLPTALEALAQSRVAAGDGEGAILCRLMAMSSPDCPNLESILAGIDDLPRENMAPWREYRTMLNDYVGNVPADPFKRDNLAYALRSMGHAGFAVTEVAPILEDYKQADSLFKAGRDLDRIVALLEECICRGPCHAPSWAYLGACMMVKQNDRMALAYLTQAVFLDNSNPLPKANLAKLYARMGYPELARGMAWSALASDAENVLPKRGYDLNPFILAPLTR